MFDIKCRVVNNIWRCSPISFKHVCILFSLWSSPNYTPVKYKGLIKKRNQITLAYLIWQTSMQRTKHFCNMHFFSQDLPFHELHIEGQGGGHGRELQKKIRLLSCEHIHNHSQNQVLSHGGKCPISSIWFNHYKLIVCCTLLSMPLFIE